MIAPSSSKHLVPHLPPRLPLPHLVLQVGFELLQELGLLSAQSRIRLRLGTRHAGLSGEEGVDGEAGGGQGWRLV